MPGEQPSSRLERQSPPPQVQMKWCPACGRNDQFRFLAARHKPTTRYVGPVEKGGICPGRVVVLTYRLDPVESAHAWDELRARSFTVEHVTGEKRRVVFVETAEGLLAP